MDIYKPNLKKGITLNGMVKIIENGQLYDKIYLLFYASLSGFEMILGMKGKSPFLEIKPYTKTSWGIN